MKKQFSLYGLLALVTLLSLLTPFSQSQTLARPLRGAASGSDTIPPLPVINLSATTGKMPGSVDLVWSAPGDDGSEGTASEYAVRFNTIPIDETNWETSVDATGEPVPGPAGHIETMTVSGLSPDAPYL